MSANPGMGASRTSPTTTPGRTTRRTRTSRTKSSRPTSPMTPSGSIATTASIGGTTSGTPMSNLASNTGTTPTTSRATADGTRPPTTRTRKPRITTPPIARLPNTRIPTTPTSGPTSATTNRMTTRPRTRPNSPPMTMTPMTKTSDRLRHGSAYDTEEPPAQRSYRAEPAHRPYRDFRTGAPRIGGRTGLGSTTSGRAPPGRRGLAAAGGEPGGACRSKPRLQRQPLHPYEHHRAILIGLSTALVTAIAVIVALMVNLSMHKELVRRPSRTSR